MKQMTDAFSQYHPLVNFLFFALVLVYSMALMHPVCLAISLAAAICYAVELTGRRAVRLSVRVALPVLVLYIFMGKYLISGQMSGAVTAS